MKNDKVSMVLFSFGAFLSSFVSLCKKKNTYHTVHNTSISVGTMFLRDFNSGF